nr:hypothetical protein Iba_chr02dCG3720 [Ipomoea batatas]
MPCSHSHHSHSCIIHCFSSLLLFRIGNRSRKSNALRGERKTDSKCKYYKAKFRLQNFLLKCTLSFHSHHSHSCIIHCFSSLSLSHGNRSWKSNAIRGERETDSKCKYCRAKFRLVFALTKHNPCPVAKVEVAAGKAKEEAKEAVERKAERKGKGMEGRRRRRKGKGKEEGGKGKGRKAAE